MSASVSLAKFSLYGDGGYHDDDGNDGEIDGNDGVDDDVSSQKLSCLMICVSVLATCILPRKLFCRMACVSYCKIRTQGRKPSALIAVDGSGRYHVISVLVWVSVRACVHSHASKCILECECVCVFEYTYVNVYLIYI